MNSKPDRTILDRARVSPSAVELFVSGKTFAEVQAAFPDASERALRMAMSRARKRYRAILMSQIGAGESNAKWRSASLRDLELHVRSLKEPLLQ